MRINLVWLLALLTVPLASANTAEIPALTGYGTSHFIAAWVVLDGQTQIGGATVFTAGFGASAARLTETDIAANSPIRYNATNLRVASGPANCGNLQAGETVTVTLRVNQANSILTGTCSGGAAAGSFTLDTDLIEIQAGDTLSFSLSLAGTILTRNPRLGITMEGYSNVTIQTEPVPDMVNEMLETFNVVAPLLFFALVVAWAEWSKEWLIYVLALLAGLASVTSLPSELNALRIVVVGAMILLAVRAIWVYQMDKERNENEG